MQPQPPHSGRIVLARGANFECLLACREWHALELARFYQRIANPGGLRLGSDVFEHAVSRPENPKKSCHTRGNCYKRRNSSEPWEDTCENLSRFRYVLYDFVFS
jgi:hypothetical protein